ncbi:Jacalin-like lectin domain superfamily [Arabidopsis suecica]|uniref:Jacalin-like lectin domain superfamily n=1 Tax=Arabidopsis suecica TaxID=45249 RepID=A0A8T1ZGJ8_ARASU|nr:Jacalin-like lectin domain superfamily [Arabidopsis suecica]
MDKAYRAERIKRIKRIKQNKSGSSRSGGTSADRADLAVQNKCLNDTCTRWSCLESIQFVKFEYVKAGKTIVGPIHGVYGRGFTQKFVVDYPNEYITSVEGTCDPVSDGSNWVRSLSFKTSKGRASPTCGVPGKRTFVFESKGRALVGFHGRAGWAIDAIGAHFGPLPIPPPRPPVEKLQGKGGEGGTSWDDGVFDVEDHGKQTMLGYEEFELGYPSEYITAVEGCYDKVFGSASEVITMLKFKTNVRTSPPFGLESTSSFKLEKEGHKVVGFHGKASHELHQFGVSVVPITK